MQGFLAGNVKSGNILVHSTECIQHTSFGGAKRIGENFLERSSINELHGNMAPELVNAINDHTEMTAQPQVGGVFCKPAALHAPCHTAAATRYSRTCMMILSLLLLLLSTQFLLGLNSECPP
jgi:hypothetical protein